MAWRLAGILLEEMDVDNVDEVGDDDEVDHIDEVDKDDEVDHIDDVDNDDEARMEEEGLKEEEENILETW